MMRKLKVLVLEERIDAVLRVLGDTGSVHLIDMRERLDPWEGVLVPYDVPEVIVDRVASLLSRVITSLSTINKYLETPEAARIKTPSRSIPLVEETTGGVLDSVERKLSEIEETVSTLENRWTTINNNLNDYQRSLNGYREKTELEKKNQEIDEGTEESEIAPQNLIDRSLLEKQMAEMENAISEIKPQFADLREDLLFCTETLQTEKLGIEAKSHFLRTDKTVYFEAYIPRPQMKDIVFRIQEASDDYCLIADESPSLEEKVPISPPLASRFLIAFEKLTTAAGWPTAIEVNPIPIAAITFPLLFGIMFADVGQGLIFILLGGLLTLFKRKSKIEEMSDILRYIFISSELFLLLGVSAIFWGFLFGEFFGPSGLIHPISLGNLGPFYFGGFEPTEEPMKMVRFAVLVGVIHLSSGMILRVANEIKKHHYKHVPISLSWLWLLLGGLVMWVYWGGVSNFAAWFDKGIFMFIGLVLLPLVLIIVFTTLVEGFMEGVGFGMEAFAETLSHTLSYGRLMALGLVHSVMNSLFLALGGVEHGHFPLSSIPLVTIGTILVMSIEGLIVFIHTLRLHWIEWFSKFYSGEGIIFKPLTMTLNSEE
jgi:V/A-type H+-transporting ATPase subunit I